MGLFVSLFGLGMERANEVGDEDDADCSRNVENYFLWIYYGSVLVLTHKEQFGYSD